MRVVIHTSIMHAYTGERMLACMQEPQRAHATISLEKSDVLLLRSHVVKECDHECKDVSLYTLLRSMHAWLSSLAWATQYRIDGISSHSTCMH